MARSLCPACGLAYLSHPGDDNICACGQPWRVLAPFPRAELSREEWDLLMLLLLTRSGGLCEVRSPDCLTPGGLLAVLPRDLVSLHHRSGRRMGGTTNPAINSLANLVISCGHGTRGCHGWIEHHGYNDPQGGQAVTRGLLVPQGVPGKLTAATDPTQVPLVLASGRRVRLDPVNPCYLAPLDGLPYAV
ncbi:hypothetical protein ACFY05_32035 [Microtetraspora fusca]|uniref:HNH endonuclease n=1 Tax=Microtetraspora fusca TaxID=1997 RepID=A0ABW6VDR9_MICFU